MQQYVALSWCHDVQAYKGKGQEYKLFWPKRPEFVRMAARYGATIVPFAGVGAEEGFDMLLDSEELRRLPVVGPMLEERSRKEVPAARRCAPVTCYLPENPPSVLSGITAVAFTCCWMPRSYGDSQW